MNITNTRNILTGVFVAVLSCFISFGCASEPQELTQARQSYEQISEGPPAKYAPNAVREAREALERAEMAYQRVGDDVATRSLAYIAQRKAQMAGVQSDIYLARRAKIENQELLVSESEEARKALISRLESRTERFQDRETALEMERLRLEEAREELKEARLRGILTSAELKAQEQKLQAQQEALATQEKKLALTQTELEQMREEKEEMKQRLEEARRRIDEFADVEETDKEIVITLTGEVLFGVGESSLRANAKRRLDDVIEVLLVRRDAELTVEGHTDSQGSEAFNQRLSEARAQSVASYLITKGVAPNRITTVGRGESDPIAPNDTPAGRSINRRVAIIIQKDT